MSELTVAALELIVDPDWSRPAVVTQVWVEAVATARTLDYEGTPVRVIGPDHLAALALQAGGSKRRERAWQLLESGAIDRPRLRTLLAVHGIDVEIGDEP